MTGQTITEKIIEDHLIEGSSRPGEEAVVRVDKLLTHDVCGPPTKDIFHREFGKDARVFDRQGLVIIPDHYIFTQDETAARNVDEMRRFAVEQDIANFYDKDSPNYKGVCHVAFVEENHANPGNIIFGTDSHTATHGALGTLAVGIGNTTGGYIAGAGHAIINTPESIRFEFDGPIPEDVMGKDVILRVIGDIGTDGADFKSMEFGGTGIRNLPLEERCTICNMSIEAGGNGIIAPDEITLAYLESIGYMKGRQYSAVREFFQSLKSDSDARYLKEYTYNSADLEPVAAMPHSPGNVRRVRDIDQKLDSVYIGSCTGGKSTDFYAFAKILNASGKPVSIPTYAVPATRKVIDFCEKTRIEGNSIKHILENAEVNMDSFYQPSCAACLGGPRDTYGRINDQPDHVRASTTNRNFPKRMGSGSVYLVSPLTAAASALTGKLTDPKEYIR